jgi:hypothetical protein
MIPQHQTPIVNPEEVTSAINTAFAEFLDVEPTTTAALFIHQQHNIDSTILTTETTHNHNDLSRNNRPPTPYALSAHTNNGIRVFSFPKLSINKFIFRFTVFIIKYNCNKFTTLQSSS